MEIDAWLISIISLFLIHKCVIVIVELYKNINTCSNPINTWILQFYYKKCDWLNYSLLEEDLYGKRWYTY